MAEIPVEKKSGIPWWVWALLGALLLIALIWWATDDDEDAAYVAPATTPPAVTQEATAPVAGPITDVSVLLGGIDQTMVGREVRLSGVNVLEAVSDAGFWIGESSERRIYAVLDEVRTPQTATEGRVDLNQGSTIDLTGTIRTRSEALQGLAAGTETDPLPPGVDHFLVVETVQTRTQ